MRWAEIIWHWFVDTFQTWRAGLALTAVLGVAYAASFILGAVAIVAFQTIGLVDEHPGNAAYWTAGFLVLPYSLATCADTIKACIRHMKMPPSALARQVERGVPEKRTAPKKPPLTDAERHERFKDMAREVDADENTDSFDKAFGAVVRPAKPSKPG